MKKANSNPFVSSSASQVGGTSKIQVDNDKDSNSWIPTSRSRAARYLLSESSSDEGSSVMEPLMANGQVANEFDEHEDGEFSEDSDEEEFNDGYDEELMGDEADRHKMSLMTEREREQVIFERSERREKLKARFEIEKKLRQSKKLQSNGCDEVKTRSLSRKQKMEGKHDYKTAAMDELVARREDRRLKAEEREKRMKLDDDASKWRLVKKENDGPKLVVNQVYSSSDSESESDWGEEVVRIPRAPQSDVESVFESRVPIEPPRQSSIKYVSSAKELSRIQMTRSICAKWVHLPFFDELIVGCFVKVVMEETKSGALYRICEVVKVFEGSSYDLEGTRTTKMVLIKFASHNQRDYALSAFSNKEFTDEEFERWERNMKNSKAEIPTLESINKKREEIRRANNYVLKDEDIDHILAVKKKLNVGRRNYALEKSILLKERAAALHRGDEQRVRELDYEIRELDEQPREQDRTRTNSLAKIAVINQRNRKKNNEIMEAAILESHEHKEEEGKKTEDPFIRRVTKPSRPSIRKEKDDHHVAADIKVIVDDVEMKSLEESQLDVEETTVIEEKTSTVDPDTDEPLPKGWIAVSNEGQRFHTPLDHSFSARNMTFFDNGHMEEMFELHDFEVTGLDESSNVSAADIYVPAMNFLPQSAFAPDSDPLAAMFSPFGVVVPMEIRPRKKITLEEYKRRRGLQ